jgi:hypothetical protein
MTTISCTTPVGILGVGCTAWYSFLLDYELGRLLACKGDLAGARRHMELVMTGKFSRRSVDLPY